MQLSYTIALALPLIGRSYAAYPTDSPLIVNEAPSSLKPYVLPHLSGFSISLGGAVYRVQVCKNSSDGAFSMLAANSGFTPLAPVHNHPTLIESFYGMIKKSIMTCSALTKLNATVNKGSANLWIDNLARIATQSDFQFMAPGSNHSLQNIDYDFEATTTYQPAGIEDFLLAVGEEYTKKSAPFDQASQPVYNVPVALKLADKYSVSVQLDFKLNNDLTNGTSTDGEGVWHLKDQKLPGSVAPYFLSSNMGPKFLNHATNQVVTTLATGAESGGNTTIATIAMGAGDMGATQSFKAAQAFQVLEGQLTIKIADQTVNLIYGDLIFLPPNTEFSYQSTVAWTKI